MFELTASSAPDYLASQNRALSSAAQCRELGGGVSNTVILVEDGDMRFVLKQALPQLRVADEWLADRSRIFRERDSLIAVERLLPKGWAPRVLWSDDDAYLYAMESFSTEAKDWKKHLLAGNLQFDHARRAGIALGLTIRESRKDPSIAKQFADDTAFDQLRTDPYYRTIARRHPSITGDVDELLAETGSRRAALTHGDWSPKNMMVDGDRMIFIDYECAHWGDPAFDSGFVLNHLILKAVHRPERAADYLGLARAAFTWTAAVLPPDVLEWFEEATCRHLAFLMLARIDGKSPVEYLTDEAARDRVRNHALGMIAERPSTIDACLSGAAELASV